MNNKLQKILFQKANARGSLVELSDAWTEMLSHQSYPMPVIKLLGEMTAAVVLLSGSIKFNGSTVMQIHGDGPVRLLVVECSNTMQIRATAKLNADIPVDNADTFNSLVNANGKGRCIITLDPHEKIPGQRPYQGIISLEGKTVSEVLENYMKRSEQLDTRIWLASDATVVRGLMLQRMPAQLDERGVALTDSKEDENTWQHLVALASTLTAKEMLSADIATLQRRLFWEEDVVAFEPLYPTFHCGCNREKVGNMLKMLGQAEVEQALQEQGTLTINCDYCGKSYRYDSIDCKALFSPVPALGTSSDTQH